MPDVSTTGASPCNNPLNNVVNEPHAFDGTVMQSICPLNVISRNLQVLINWNIVVTNFSGSFAIITLSVKDET